MTIFTQNNNDRSEKIVLITGASRGIGASILTNLVKENYYVCGTATSEESATSITKKIKNFGGQGCGLKLDFSSDNPDEFVKSLIKLHGSPSIFINNAGITRDNLILRMSNDDWNDVIEVNLSTAFRLTKALLKSMVKSRWGRIVFLSSIVGLSGNAGQANYAAAKAGLGAFCRSLAKEVAKRGITVNSIAPGYIETDMTKSLKDDLKDIVLDSIPISRFGKPEDVANAVSFLISDDASYITGITLNVDGGLFMT